MMKPRFFSAGTTIFLVLWFLLSLAAAQTPVLDEKIMSLSVEAAKLSALAYEEDTAQYATADGGFSHPDYESIKFYTDEPDQAILAKSKTGHCFLSFRGTTLDIFDWFQNVGLGSIDVYKNNNSTGESCNAREGYANFLFSDLVQTGAADLAACAANCSDPDDCVVLTGHSQGAAISTLAAILLHRYQPLLITFGGPLAVSRDCDLIVSERAYRYVNSLHVVAETEEEEDEIIYDPVPLFPGFGQGRGHYGYYLLLGEDMTALKFLGIDDKDSGFSPGPQTSAAPHTLGAANGEYSYESRVTALYNHGEFPVNIEGFSGGVPCDMTNGALLCASDDCAVEGEDSLDCAAVPTPMPTPTPETTMPVTSMPNGDSSATVINGWWLGASLVMVNAFFMAYA